MPRGICDNNPLNFMDKKLSEGSGAAIAYQNNISI
jgi:hypothetical protein